jgi:16S rRNA (uracil1498-N3)-methyltransferase
MSYPYFFIKKDAVRDDSIIITGEDYRHLIKVLRAKMGDVIGISDNKKTRYSTVIEKIDHISATLRILDSRQINRRIPEIHMYICVLKKDAMETAIQKNTEIGVDIMIPVISNRVVVEVTEDKKRNRLLRWQQIAYNASKQSKRSFICTVSDFITIDNIIPCDYDVFFLLYEGPFNDIKGYSFSGLMGYFGEEKIKGMKKIAFLVGPEGGFEKNEAEKLINRGATGINFGKNILKSDTASIYFASIIDFLFKISDG